MDIGKTLSGAQDAMNARRVYAEPYERNGTTVILAASVQGGGGGFGLSARPIFLTHRRLRRGS